MALVDVVEKNDDDSRETRDQHRDEDSFHAHHVLGGICGRLGPHT